MNKRYLWLAAGLAFFFACGKTGIAPDIPEQTPEEVNDPWLYEDLSDRDLPATGESMTIKADFGDTRTQIEMNDTETYAATVWTQGDAFRMYGIYYQSDKWYRSSSTFRTTAGGLSADFTGSAPSTPSPFYSIYPQASKWGFAEDGRILMGVEVPSTQTAVAGRFAEGLAVASAVSQNGTDYLHFKSQVSLIRFRMTGTLVSQITQVSIRGAHSLAGNAIIVFEEDGSMSLTQDRSFGSDVHYSTVTLTGPFVAGNDYYLVLYPGTHSRFQMIFADDEGHSTTLSGSAFTFPRAGISDFGTIDLGDAFADEYVDTTPIQYMTASAGAPKPVTIAVIPDGFTASELGDYELLAKSGIDALMATEPYKSYKEFFNVWILKVASRESGANITDGDGNITTPVDCYFGSMWGEDEYDDMEANEDLVYEFVTSHCPDIVNQTHTIYEVPVLMIINDRRYGGICHSWSNGKGYGMVPFTYGGDGISWRYANNGREAASATATPWNTRQVTQAEREEMGLNNGDWRNTLVHEFGGHCFGRLKDEYWYTGTYGAISSIDSHSWPVPFGLNISPSYDNPTWKTTLLGDDLNVRQSLLQKDSRYGRIGIYQGGDVSMFNRWRSEKISCMIDNRFYFSTWQRWLIVNRIMTLSGSVFDEEVFWANDDPTDPVREQVSGSAAKRSSLPLREMPLLPPPVLHED